MAIFIVRPSPRVYYLKIILAVLVMTTVIYILGTTLEKDLTIGIGIVWGIGIVMGIAATISLYFKSIEISEEDMLMKIGVFNVKNVMVPYKQITNVNIKRTIFDRMVGLGKIEIDTPGTNVAELSMDHIPKKGLNDIMEFLREKNVRVSK